MVVSAEQRRDVDHGHGVDVGELRAGRRYRDEAAVERVPQVAVEQAKVADLPQSCEIRFNYVGNGNKRNVDE